MAVNYTPVPELNYTPAPTQSKAFAGPQYTPAPTKNYTPALNYTPGPGDPNYRERKSSGDVLGASSDRSEKKNSFNASDALSDLGFGNKSEFKAKTGYSSVETYLNDLRKEESNRKKEQEKKAGEIGAAFDPIFSELDRQLGQLSGRQRDFESQIARSAQTQLEDVDTRTSASKETLEQERDRGLRDLESDIRNQLQAAGRVIGAAGAGTSSAAGQATEAIARIGQRARSDLNQGVATQLQEIENLALQQKSDINTWKQDKLFEITDFFAQQLDALNLQKSGASRDKQNSIAQLEFQIQQDYLNQLRGLDQQVLQYNQSIEDWQRSRTSNYNQFIGNQNQSVYGGIEGINTALNLFGNLTGQGVSDNEARAIVEAQGLYLPGSVNTEESFNDRFGLQAAPVTTESQQVADDPFAGLGI